MSEDKADRYKALQELAECGMDMREWFADFLGQLKVHDAIHPIHRLERWDAAERQARRVGALE